MYAFVENSVFWVRNWFVNRMDWGAPRSGSLVARWCFTHLYVFYTGFVVGSLLSVLFIFNFLLFGVIQGVGSSASLLVLAVIGVSLLVCVVCWFLTFISAVPASKHLLGSAPASWLYTYNSWVSAFKAEPGGGSKNLVEMKDVFDGFFTQIGCVVQRNKLLVKNYDISSTVLVANLTKPRWVDSSEAPRLLSEAVGLDEDVLVGSLTLYHHLCEFTDMLDQNGFFNPTASPLLYEVHYGQYKAMLEKVKVLTTLLKDELIKKESLI